MDCYSLYYGTFDFIVNPDGEFVFLELNPKGQYLWLEESTKQPITMTLAKYLSKI